MVAFRIQVNREEALTAGLPGRRALSVFVDCRVIPGQYRMSVSGGRISEVGHGTTHAHWERWSLEVGDQITVSIVDVPESEVSPPSKETGAFGTSEDGEREELARLLEKYGAP
jgi:hypothetical protein